MGLFAGLFVGLALGVLVFHFVVLFHQKKRFSEVHRDYLNRMAQQQAEIKLRQMYLEKYRFMDYNLSEVLVIQPQIVLP